MATKLFSLKTLTFAALLLSAAAAQADITVYTDRTAFLAAVTAPGVDTYDDLAVQLYDSPLARNAGAYGYTASSASGLFGAGGAGDRWLSNNVLQDPIVFSNFSGGVNALGGNFFGTNAFGDFIPNTSMVLTATDGTSTTFTLDNTTTDSFVGFVSSAPLASVTLTSAGDYWPTANNLTLAMAAPIPEPGTYAMMLAGLALVGGVTRRRVQA